MRQGHSARVFDPAESSGNTGILNGKNNQLNVPQAREAMDKFKMQDQNDIFGISFG